MTARLDALCFDANEPLRLARFWAEALRWDIDDETGDEVALVPTDATTFGIRFRPVRKPKVEKNRLHLDLTTTSLDDQRESVERLVALGARHIDIGQRPDDAHVVLADPEGNELCIIEPGNNFLATCERLGSITCDGTQEVGYFWSAALAWPLVWDQDEETAIHAPDGTGPMITWGAAARAEAREEPVPPRRRSARPTSIGRQRSTASWLSARRESTQATARAIGWPWPIPTTTSFGC